jgi:hypothetical protein
MVAVRLLLVCAIALASAPEATSAQSLRGSVRDLVSGEPLPGAVLVLVDSENIVRMTIVSDSVGAFLLTTTASTELRLRVQRVGYAELETAPFSLAASDSLEIVVPLRPEPIALADVTATADRPRNANFERFEIRRETGFGRSLGPDEIAAIRPQTTVGLMSMLDPGARISSSGRGIMFPGVVGGHCTPIVYVDGMQISEQRRVPVPGLRGQHSLQEDGIVLDRFVPARDVRAVELYRNPSHAPQEFRWAYMPRCAILLVWTVYGFGLDRVPETRVDGDRITSEGDP